MTNPNRDKTGRKTILLGLVMSLGVTAIIAYSANATTTTTGGSPTPVPVPTAGPTLTPMPEPPPATVTVTETPAPAPAPAPPAGTTTVQPPTTQVYPPRTTHAAPAPTPNPERGDPPVAGSAGAYISDEEIRSEVLSAVDVANQYWINLFSSWKDAQGNPVQWWTPALYRGDGFYDSARYQTGPMCGSKQMDGAGFCGDVYSGTGFMAWDMQFFRDYSEYGDAAFYMIVAHEVGHAAQNRFLHDGEVEAVLDNWEGEYELQADCIGGATLAKAEQEGLLTRDPGDLEEMAQVSAHSGSYTEHSHGTPEQRREYFQRGYQSADIESCLGNRQ